MEQCGGRNSWEANVIFIDIGFGIDIVIDIVIGSVLVVANYLLEAEGRVGSPGRLGRLGRGISGHVIRPRKAASSLPLLFICPISPCFLCCVLLVLLLLLLVLLWSRDPSTESCL